MANDAQTSTEDKKDDSMISSGDLIQLEVDAWIKETGKLFQTTNKENAEKEGIYDEKLVYSPIYEIVGKNRFFAGLEKSILEAKVGEEMEVDIKPEDAAGPRDPGQVKLYSVREFERMEVEPKVGLDVRLGDRVGRITQVTVGRVRVDFNNPLAGHVLKYRYKVLRKVAEPLEKVKALIDMYYGTNADFDVSIDGKQTRVVLPDSVKLDQKWIAAKLRVVADSYETAGMEQVEFVERYTKTAPAAKEEKAEEPREPPAEEQPAEGSAEEKTEEK